MTGPASPDGHRSVAGIAVEFGPNLLGVGAQRPAGPTHPPRGAGQPGDEALHGGAVDLAARGSIIEVDGTPMQGLIARLSRTPGRVRWAGRPLGADTEEVRAELDRDPGD